MPSSSRLKHSTMFIQNTENHSHGPAPENLNTHLLAIENLSVISQDIKLFDSAFTDIITSLNMF